MTFQNPPPPSPGPGDRPGTTYVGQAVPGRVARLAELVDQLALAGFVVFWLGVTFLAGTRLEDPPGLLIGAGVLTAVFGVIVCILVEARLASRHGTTVGRFLLGIRIHPAVQLSYLDSLELIFEFWHFTAIDAAGSFVDRVVPGSAQPGEPEPVLGTVRDSRCRGPAARCARLVTGLLIVLSPVPMVLALVG